MICLISYSGDLSTVAIIWDVTKLPPIDFDVLGMPCPEAFKIAQLVCSFLCNRSWKFTDLTIRFPPRFLSMFWYVVPTRDGRSLAPPA